MKKKTYIIIFLIILILFAVIIKNAKSSGGKATSTEDNSSNLGIPVELKQVTKSNMMDTIKYVGTIEPKKTATLSPTIAGQIVHVYVEEGSLVKYGDTLMKIDDSQLKASIDTAQSKLDTLSTNYKYLTDEVNEFYETNPLIKQLETAKSNYDYLNSEYPNYKGLYDEGAIPKTTYDKIEQELNNAYLKTEELKANIQKSYDKLVHEKNISAKQIEELNSSINELRVKVEDTTIKAPISGIVKMVQGDVGDLAVIGKPVISIDDIEELIVKVNVSESDLKKISANSDAIIKIAGLDDEILTRVNKIVPNFNPNTRIGLIELGPLKNQSATLFSGNSAEVEIIVNELKDRIIVPKNSIKNLNVKNVVYLYDDGVVKEVEINTGATVGDNTEIISGLKEGDRIAATNLSKLYDNATVYVFKGDE